MILSTLIMTSVQINYALSKSQVENRARSMGMIYPEEAKVINGEGTSK